MRGPLVLLRHNRSRWTGSAKWASRQVPHAVVNLNRVVAIEFGIWRSGRNGGASGSVTVGNGKFRERRGATSS
jgi:hypothetical protein